MFKGFVNRLYNGNPNRPDYNKEDMPETRWQLFWVAFKARVMDIFYISLMISIFALPTLIWTFLNVAAFFNALEAVSYTHLDVYKRQALGSGKAPPRLPAHRASGRSRPARTGSPPTGSSPERTGPARIAPI